MHSRRRPKTTTLAIILIFLLGILNLWKAFGLWQQADLLKEFGATINPTLLLIAAAIWGVLFATASAIAWFRWRSMRLFIPLALIIYTIYNIVLPTPNMPIMLWHIALTLIAAAALSLKQKPLKTQTTHG